MNLDSILPSPRLKTHYETLGKAISRRIVKERRRQSIIDANLLRHVIEGYACVSLFANPCGPELDAFVEIATPAGLRRISNVDMCHNPEPSLAFFAAITDDAGIRSRALRITISGFLVLCHDAPSSPQIFIDVDGLRLKLVDVTVCTPGTLTLTTEGALDESVDASKAFGWAL